MRLVQSLFIDANHAWNMHASPRDGHGARKNTAARAAGAPLPTHIVYTVNLKYHHKLTSSVWRALAVLTHVERRRLALVQHYCPRLLHLQ